MTFLAYAANEKQTLLAFGWRCCWFLTAVLMDASVTVVVVGAIRLDWI